MIQRHALTTLSFPKEKYKLQQISQKHKKKPKELLGELSAFIQQR